MNLSEVALALGLSYDLDDIQVCGISHRADWIQPGWIFVAIRGARVDGHQFIEQAKEHGAVAVIGEGLNDRECSLPYLTVENARIALAQAASELYGNPSRLLRVIGITGTDGKTTTSCLTHHLLQSAGQHTGLLSTVGYRLPHGALQEFPSHFTTPEAPQVQELLHTMLHQHQAQNVVLEASSHALALERVRGVDWNVAVWTQLTSEHLDFHGSIESYFDEKKKLIERAPFAVLNADDPHTQKLRGVAAQETTYGLEGKGEWQALNIDEQAHGISFELHSPAGNASVFLPMIGRFNVANALAAAAAVSHLGLSLDEIVQGLASFQGVPGRMEVLTTTSEQPRVIIDFAHTPPSLEKALQTLRSTTTGKLIVVLGSAGGPRDPSKRAPLGEVSTRLADQVIFTEEDHRDTPLEDILQEMERGAAGRSNFVSIPDRREALMQAIQQGQAGDTILLAGKGAETTLERGHETISWNERQEAEIILRG